MQNYAEAHKAYVEHQEMVVDSLDKYPGFCDVDDASQYGDKDIDLTPYSTNSPYDRPSDHVTTVGALVSHVSPLLSRLRSVA